VQVLSRQRVLLREWRHLPLLRRLSSNRLLHLRVNGALQQRRARSKSINVGLTGSLYNDGMQVFTYLIDSPEEGAALEGGFVRAVDADTARALVGHHHKAVIYCPANAIWPGAPNQHILRYPVSGDRKPTRTWHEPSEPMHWARSRNTSDERAVLNDGS